MEALTLRARIEATRNLVTYREPGNPITLYPRPYQVRAHRNDRGRVILLQPLTVIFDHDPRPLRVTPEQIAPPTPSPSESI